MNQLVGAAFGAAGQRCMALSTAVFVGEAKEWVTDLKARTEKLVVNEGWLFFYGWFILKCVFLFNFFLLKLLF